MKECVFIDCSFHATGLISTLYFLFLVTKFVYVINTKEFERCVFDGANMKKAIMQKCVFIEYDFFQV
jgi:hypothetical protein